MTVMLNKLLIATAKGVRAGIYADRVFAVVDEREGRLVAWKCDLLSDGRLSHPAFPDEPLSRTDQRLFIKAGDNGSTPTAFFKYDSFYKEWSGGRTMTKAYLGEHLTGRSLIQLLVDNPDAHVFVRVGDSIVLALQSDQVVLDDEGDLILGAKF